MQRPIKFRAWDKKNKEFLWNFDINMDGRVLTVGYSVFGEPGTDVSEFVELLQFTGLLDKNGVEIYEGYLVECVDMHDVNCFGRAWTMKDGIAIANPMLIKKDKDGVDWEWFDGIRYYTEYWKVIGNIYQNPELLKD